MGYSRRSYKKTIQNYKFIKGRFQIEILMNEHFTSCNVSKMFLLILKYPKRNNLKKKINVF